MAETSKTQVKSKQRVADHGEVFTNEREVNAMLDLVKQETERIDSRFLEPACGDGNFLAEILKRKLDVVKSKYKKFPSDYEKYAVLAATSIYGVDIQQDNVDECRARLFSIWNKEYTSNCKKEANDETREAVKYILSKNILCGDALSMEQSDGSPIIFAEWSMINGFMLKRRDFRLDVLLKENDDENMYDNNLSLFSDDASYSDYWMIDPVTNEQVPKPVTEYTPIHYRKVIEHE